MNGNESAKFTEPENDRQLVLVAYTNQTRALTISEVADDWCELSYHGTLWGHLSFTPANNWAAMQQTYRRPNHSL